MKCVTSNGEETWSLVPVEDFQNEVINLSAGIDATGADCLDIDYPKEYRHPSVTDDRRVEFWMRSADRARELERLSSTTAAEAPPDKKPSRPLRRRKSKYDWDEICAEIAALCHDESGRVCVPANESELVGKVLEFCEDKPGGQPAPSEMHKTVQVICARFRKIIPGKR
jgi:hypothetical protein